MVFPNPVCRDPIIAVSAFSYIGLRAMRQSVLPLREQCADMALKFDTSFDPRYGQGVNVAPDVQRVTVRNPSPFTFHGTNSYIVGRDTLAVIDPGPDDEAHLQTLLDVIAGRPVSHIFVSHTHRDHSPLAARLKERTGATVMAEGPHRPARALHIGETNALDASADTAFVPDIALPDNVLVDGDGWAIRTVLTPATPPIMRCSRWKEPASCFRPIMSWRGRHPSSRRRTERWPITWHRWTGSSRAMTACCCLAMAGR